MCSMLPHGDSMCLLDQVQDWNPTRITCLANSHRSATNPLRNNAGLPMVALLEYGAQAMAVHGCLLAQSGEIRLQEGYLAALRDVSLADGWLSDVEGPLQVEAVQVYKDGGNMVYTLSVQADGRKLASARATAVGKLSEDNGS